MFRGNVLGRHAAFRLITGKYWHALHMAAVLRNTQFPRTLEFWLAGVYDIYIASYFVLLIYDMCIYPA